MDSILSLPVYAADAPCMQGMAATSYHAVPSKKSVKDRLRSYQNISFVLCERYNFAQ